LTIIEFSATSLERSGFRGAAVAPGDERWDAARQAFNVLVDQRPALIAFPADEHDVAAAVRFARENGLRVAPQRTGHNAGPLGALDDTILLKTDALEGVSIDAAGKVARVGAATRWADVVPQASELGLAALHGSTPDVSVVGYSLGGGLGWYGRKLGLAANSVVAVELVTADGRLRRVDQEHEPELFWALRGGGGSFGVVTSIEFRLYPLCARVCGRVLLPLGALGGSAPRVAGMDRDGAGRDHVGWPDPPLPAAAGRPRAASRPLVRARRSGLSRR
jgi:FAD/FMN-containing dehydrogenase